MGLIELEKLDVEIVELPRSELMRLLDEETNELLGMPAEAFIAAVEAGEEFENPAATRLEVLAEALIEPQRRSG